MTQTTTAPPTFADAAVPHEPPARIPSSRVSRRAGESGEQLAAAQSADFQRVGFHHRLADRYLSVTAERDLAVATNGQYGSRADALELTFHSSK